MKTILSTLALSIFLNSSTAQEFGPINVPSNGIVDGVYMKETVPTKKIISYEYVREADVMWSKRVWQSIDMRQKINHPLYFPLDDYDASGNWVKNSSRHSLWTVLKTHILNGDLQVFSPYNPMQYTITDGDQLKYPVVAAPGKNYYTDPNYHTILFSYLGSLGPQPTRAISNFDGTGDSTILIDGLITPVYPPRDTTWFTSKDIIAYNIKEDWFIDKERGTEDVRIIAIAPVVYDKDPDSGEITGTRELFWLYFPHCRYVLNNYYTFNAQNDAQWMSFDDLFWKRRFSATTYKESNVYDRKIESYKSGADALHEADKVKEEIRTIEHDLWSF